MEGVSLTMQGKEMPLTGGTFRGGDQGSLVVSLEACSPKGLWGFLFFSIFCFLGSLFYHVLLLQDTVLAKAIELAS